LWKRWIHVLTAPEVQVKNRCVVVSLQVVGFGEVYIYCIYGITKNGFGANQWLYSKNIGHLEKHGKPYVLGGDHNMEPKELAAGLSYLGFQSQPVYKFPPQPTCFPPVGIPRCLDYFVVANVLAVTCSDVEVVQQQGLALATPVPVSLVLRAALLQETVSVLIKFDMGDAIQKIGPMQCFDELWTGQYWPAHDGLNQDAIDQFAEVSERKAHEEAQSRFGRCKPVGVEFQYKVVQIQEALQTKVSSRATPSQAYYSMGRRLAEVVALASRGLLVDSLLKAMWSIKSLKCYETNLVAAIGRKQAWNSIRDLIAVHSIESIHEHLTKCSQDYLAQAVVSRATEWKT